MKGLNTEVVSAISEAKAEPNWMREFRQASFKVFEEKSLPSWDTELSHLDFEEFFYFMRPPGGKHGDWRNLPTGLRRAYDGLGVRDAEQRYCGGLQAQWNSEAVYGSLRDQLDRQGIIFTDTDTALRQYPDLVRQYFGTVVAPTENKFAALNATVWSGGAFVYLPAGATVDLPLHGYFHIGTEHIGQFEHTLIVLEEGASLNYFEACSSPADCTDSLHTGTVEIVVGPHARCRFTSIQNWNKDTYNLATKRAIAHEGAIIEWIGGNLGAHVTMSYPCVYLLEPGARAEMLSLSVAVAGQHQDAGAKMVHAAGDTTSRVISKSISKDGGRTTFRGLVQIAPGSRGARSHVSCDSLILDAHSRCDTYPHIDVEERECEVGHEASVSKIEDEALLYLMSRGLAESEAAQMIVSGFVEPLVKELPMCYACQLNDLIRLQMTGTVG